MSPPARPNPVLKHALPLPSMNKMINKRVVLASASPRRLEILSSLGLSPEVIPSTFAEDLPHSSFSDDLTKYPTATAGEKGREVYERLVGGEAAEEGVDLVIAADTVVIYPPVRDPEARLELGEGTGGEESIILEKPTSPGDNLRTLLNLSGKTVQVVTSVVLVYPTLTNPGFALRSLSDSTLVTFHENSRAILEAYVDSGEGMGKAGGFGVQGLGGLLVEKIEGDHNNVVGFPASAFFRWMDELLEEDEDFLNI